jgi:hypothetical protein
MTSTTEPARPATENPYTARDPSRSTSSRRVTRFDLRCLLCARILGSADADRWGSAGPVLFRAEGSERVVRVADWRRLRCRACGGNAYPDEVRTARLYPPVRWDDDDRPRRGRPPKWLVEARKTEPVTSE